MPYILLLLAGLILQGGQLQAQRYYNEGNKYFDRNLFEEAIPFYLKEIEKKGSYKYKLEAREKLANCYRLTGQFLEASEMYKYILDKGSKKNRAENLLNYGNSLKNAAKYEEAAEIFKKYIELEPDDPMGDVYLGSCAMAQMLLDEESKYIVKNVERINTPGSEYAPVFYEDGIVFSASRPDSRKKFINISDNIDVMRSDLYFSDLALQPDGTSLAENLMDLNSSLHDGTACFSKDGNKVFFARTVTGSKNKKSNTVVNSLQIFYSEKDAKTGKWSKPVSAFSFNSHNYSVAQPCLSDDGKRIYFASDMPGGIGNMDIYYSDLSDNGEWGDPVNLGPAINTFGYELFPYIKGKDTLYFSSDTHPGMGKLDIFRAVRTNGNWGWVNNMGVPVNSIGDDFGIVLDHRQLRGFFTSDRFNGMGKEDIYTLWKLGYHDIYLRGNRIEFPDLTLFNGIIYRISEDGTNESETLKSENGYYGYTLKDSADYTINVRKDGFFYDVIKVRLSRSLEKSYMVADIQARNASYIVRGTLTEREMEITSEEQLMEGSKKDYITVTDTSWVEVPLPDVTILLSSSQVLMNLAFTNESGAYGFADTLYPGMVYNLLAVRPEKTEPEPVDEDMLDRMMELAANSSTGEEQPDNTILPEEELISSNDNGIMEAEEYTQDQTVTEEIKPVESEEPVIIQPVQEEAFTFENINQDTGSGNTTEDQLSTTETGGNSLQPEIPDPSFTVNEDTIQTAGSLENMFFEADTTYVPDEEVLIPEENEEPVYTEQNLTAPSDSLPADDVVLPVLTEVVPEVIVPEVKADSVADYYEEVTAEIVPAEIGVDEAVENTVYEEPIADIPVQDAENNVQETVIAEIKETTIYNGVVQDQVRKKPVDGVDLKVFDGDSLAGQLRTRSNGEYAFELEQGRHYDLYATREGYFQANLEIEVPDGKAGEQKNLDILMEPVVPNKDVRIKNILFDFNQFTLRKESMRELDRLAEFLTTNPDLTIELNAHTDSRGAYYPNLILSYKRAENTRDYLVAKGIDLSRIYSNGFGETFPLVKNATTESEHEQNRRVEFRIIDKADVMKGSIHSQTGFSVLSHTPYSKKQPIPEAEPLPDGLNFRIDLGSYNKEVADDAFSGAFPVVKEWDPEKKVYRYYAGLFNSVNEAEDALRIISKEVPGKLEMKAYFNSSLIPDDELGMIRQASREVIDKNEPLPVISTEYPVFSVQIGAFTGRLSPLVVADFRRLAGNYGLHINKLNGYTIYSIGLFDSPEQAMAVREELVRKGISDKAFLIAWYKGQRITATEGKSMLGKQ